MKRTRLPIFIFFLLFTLHNGLQAQEIFTDPIGKYLDSIRFSKDEIEQIRHLHFQGYFQMQYQKIDTAGMKSFAGGDFLSNANNRFMVRRGRLRSSYKDEIAEYVIQFDGTERGVSVKDAFIRLTEPKNKKLSLTAGLFDRPFGYEISYSSRLRESPERGRMSQTLFAGERDLGAMITYLPLNKKYTDRVKLDVALFNGNGSSAPEFDSHKDFITRITIKNSDESQYRISGGVSFYDGKVDNPTNVLFKEIVSTSTGDHIFLRDSSSSNKFKPMIRKYWGLNFQMNFSSVIGFTILRMEYIKGMGIGTSASTLNSPTIPTTDLYQRNFDGAYFYLIQNILKTRHQIVFKYDWYDPNKEIKGKEIGKLGSYTGIPDIRFDTWGLGYLFRLNEHVRLMAYYDYVSNELTSVVKTSTSLDYTKDLKDNVITFRMQYRF